MLNLLSTLFFEFGEFMEAFLRHQEILLFAGLGWTLILGVGWEGQLRDKYYWLFGFRAPYPWEDYKVEKHQDVHEAMLKALDEYERFSSNVNEDKLLLMFRLSRRFKYTTKGWAEVEDRIRHRHSTQGFRPFPLSEAEEQARRWFK